MSDKAGAATRFARFINVTEPFPATKLSCELDVPPPLHEVSRSDSTRRFSALNRNFINSSSGVNDAQVQNM